MTCNRFLTAVSALVLSTAFASGVFAQKSWNQTGSGTLNWATSGNWTPSGVPGPTEDARITNDLAAAQIITNASGTINFLAISNGLGAATVKVITGGGLISQFGIQLGKNSILEIAHTSRFGTNEFLTFDLRAGGQPGTLVISNGAALFLVRGTAGTANTNAVVNAGTIHLVSAAGQNSQINYGQTTAFTNLSNGTIVKTGVGTGSFIGEFGGRNRPFINDGTIIVREGVLRIDPRDAFASGGFRNTASGFLQIDTNAVVELRRTANAWINGPAPTNAGTIFMNGGILRTFSDGVADTGRTNVNAAGGVIRGHGLLDFQVRNHGVIEARNGTLTVIGAAGNIGTWVSTNFGGAESVLNFTTGNFDLSGGTLLNSNGTLRLTGGANLTISTSYGNNAGTIEFAGAANLLMPNVAGLAALTNSLLIKKTAAGSATITTGHGSGQHNYGLVNKGTISVAGGGTLTLNPNNAFSNPFSNAPSGTIVIESGNALRLSRTAAAWTGGASPVNAGTITLNGGSLETADAGALNPARFIRNIGRIEGTGTLSASLSNLSGGIVAPGLSLGKLTVTGAVVFADGSVFEVQLGLLAGQNDELAIHGSLTLDAGSILSISGGTIGNVYTVMTFNALSGVFGSFNDPATYIVTYNPANITITVIPEPSAMLLAVSGLAALTALARCSRPGPKT